MTSSPRPPSSASTAPESPAVARRHNRPASLRTIVLIRLVNAWCIKTFFQPDEFFQALEPAWRLAFGPHSRAWLTWEWHHRLRSSLHPALFSAAYLVADTLSCWLPVGHAWRTAVVMAAPKAVQAVIAALGDWYTWQLAVKIYGPDDASSLVVLLLQLLSPWQWYVSTRTFSNSLETTLTAMALYYWPWHLLGTAVSVKENPKPRGAFDGLCHLRASLCLAALAVLLRPTNALIWATVVGVTVSRVTLTGSSPLTSSHVWTLLREATLCSGLMAGISLVADRLYFGSWTFPPLHWLYFNISKSLAVFYGRNPWHYYLLQGLPLLCTTSLPFALWGLCRPPPSSLHQGNVLRTLSCAVAVTVAALSLISHKEVRFIYPLLPLLNIVAAPRVLSAFTSTRSDAAPSPARLRNRSYLAAALTVNVCLAGYLGSVHQAAPLAVVSYLRQEYARLYPPSTWLASEATHRAPDGGDGPFALFLMPCHSTPWRSHLVHPGLDARALTCEPPLHTQPGTAERAGYRDEADRFYDDPLRFLRTELFAGAGGLRAPRYLVGFEGVEPWLRRFVDTPEARAAGLRGLRAVWSAYNGLFSDDARRAGRMLVWEVLGERDDDDAPSGLGA
ncbi:hypothetical protein CDD83_7670 [Cordyceps sp. RAO-2017]|nr:hypothetical protein CDD83_7670 [Cordyceps sp. RAO-2017]